MIVVLCAAISVFLHMVLGWQWTLLAGLLCGVLMPGKGWLWGFVSVALGWGILVLIDYFAAPDPFGRMIDVTGQILGNMPGAMVVVVTLLIGGILGLLGGLIGQQLGLIFPSLNRREEAMS